MPRGKQLGRKERRKLARLAQTWQAPRREREPIRVEDPERLKAAVREGLRRAGWPDSELP